MMKADAGCRGAYLAPYQETGARFLAGRKRACLFDEAGLGKTRQALAAAEIVGGRVLVLCPALVVPEWYREIETVDFGGDVDVVSYQKFIRNPTSYSAEILILDEAHKLANPGSVTHMSVYGRIDDFDFVWALTATPKRNYNNDYYQFIRYFCGVDVLPAAFEKFSCHVDYSDLRIGNRVRRVKAIRGSKNTEEIEEQIAVVCLRRTKAELACELPPISFFELAVNTGLKEDLAFERFFSKPVREIAENAELAEWAQAVGTAKIPALIEHIDNSTEKTLVFAHFKGVVSRVGRALSDKLIPFVVLDGDTPFEERKKRVENFNRDSSIRVAICSLTAASEGLNLQTASAVYFLERSFSPAVNYQAYSRAYRRGQTKPVVVFTLVDSALSFDRWVSSVLARKKRE